MQDVFALMGANDIKQCRDRAPENLVTLLAKVSTFFLIYASLLLSASGDDD